MKVLIFSHNCISESNNNGKTLLSIFSSFKNFELSQFFLSDNEMPNLNACSSFFFQSDRQMLKSFIFQSKFGETIMDTDNNQKQPSSLLFKKSFTSSSGFTFKRCIALYFRSLLWRLSNWEEKSFEWIEQQNCNMIFFVAGDSVFSHIMARKISKKFNLPLITYITDDYILNSLNESKKGNYNANFYTKKLVTQFKKTISDSKKNYVIGEEMQVAYSSFFKTNFHTIMNSVDYKPLQSFINKDNDVVKIEYYGGLHLGRIDMLYRLSIILRKAINDIGKDMEFNIYSVAKINDKEKELFINSDFNFKGPISSNLIDEQMSKADMLVLVESDDMVYRKMTRYSVSTKIPEYLISSCQILAYGPPEVASLNLIESNNLGIYINSELIKDVDYKNKKKKEIQHFIENDFDKQEMIQRGYDFAVNNFLKENVSKKVYKDLSNIY